VLLVFTEEEYLKKSLTLASFTLCEYINVEADLLATKGLGLQQRKHIMLPGNQGELYIKGKQVTSHFTKALQIAFHSVKMHCYLKEKNGWSDKTIANIWWKAHGKALNALKEGNKRMISKFLHNRLPCNRRENILIDLNTAHNANTVLSVMIIS
jgi:hypothetical protein